MRPPSGFTCALVGPDGAGKTTLCMGLARTLSMPIKHIYMGVNPEAANHLLPTTRIARKVKRLLGVPKQAGGPPERSKKPATQRSGPRAWLRGTRAVLRLGNLVAEEWYLQLLAWYFKARGYLVVFDRHYIADYNAHDMQTRSDASFTRRIHGSLLRFYPTPDLVVVLDAPAPLLFARKPEGSLEALEQRRAEYLDLQGVFPELVVVDASQPAEHVLEQVTRTIIEYSKRGASA